MSLSLILFIFCRTSDFLTNITSISRSSEVTYLPDTLKVPEQQWIGDLGKIFPDHAFGINHVFVYLMEKCNWTTISNCSINQLMDIDYISVIN